MRVIAALLFLVSLSAQAVLTVTLIPFDDACGNGTGRISAIASGGVGAYNYVWSPAPPAGQGTASASGLFAGTYTVTVTDAMANQVVQSATVNTIGTLLPGSYASGALVSCDGACNGSGALSIYTFMWGGLPPYSASVMPSGSASVAATSVHLSGLCPMTSYTCTVTDANGCASTFTNLTTTDYATPVLLNQTITGSCAGGSTGSAILEFDQVGSAGAWNIGGFWEDYLVIGNQVLLNDLAPGQYGLIAYPQVVGGGMPPQVCGFTMTVTIPVSPNPCGSIDGTVYCDLNADCVQDPTDVPYPQRIVSVQPGNHYMFTNASGQYNDELFYGPYDVNVTNAFNYTPICPATVPAPFTLNAVTPSVTVDFALDPITGPDVAAVGNVSQPVPGFPVTYHLSAINNGPYTFGAFDLTLTYDATLTYTSSSAVPVVNTPGFLQFTVPGLAPFSGQYFTVELQMPPNPALIGTFLDATVAVLPVPPDAAPANDSYFLSRLIGGAYDPNDKQALTSSRLSSTQYFLDADDHIDYTIRFQNTGTLAATTVQLVDTLSSSLDIGSLEVLAASHAFEVSLVSDSILVFDFPNIQLPDSASDPLGSQGSTTFRIRPKAGLVIGDVIANNADIYFDFNPPIRTNTVLLAADFTTAVQRTDPRAMLTIWPNPAEDRLFVQSSRLGAGSWTVRDAFGRSVRSGKASSGQLVIPLEGIAAGIYLLEVEDALGHVSARFVKR
jgi:uncharacterized repeat protein (TIGR01451 family)